MAKVKSKYVCQNCGYIAPKWMGKCPECNEWNSFVEEILENNPQNFKNINVKNDKPIKLSNVSIVKEDRFTTSIFEMDLVLGGGIVKGSLVLVGGDPGIGKSTLLLQVASNVSNNRKTVLYVSGEESMKQIKFRADRLGISGEDIYIMSENNMDVVIKNINEIKPDVLIIDSIQTVYDPKISSSPGSVSQVREVTNDLMRVSKGQGVATFIVGHVTKNGSIAGPKVLEHMVDTVLYFEGEKSNIYRILRAVKNRFGSTNEIGLFEMMGNGLTEVKNPSKLFLSNSHKNVAGSITVATIEGTRAVLVEIQALISSSNFGTPRRMAIGVDYNKIVMIMAVLEKKVGLMLNDQDGYVNVVGGIVLNEPAVDLAIAIAITSSFRNVEVDRSFVVFGEVGLTGEVRAINHIQQRLNESRKLGFSNCIVPKSNLEGVDIPKGLNVYGVSNIEEAFSIIF
ncbi:DNA repair protein RadA [Helicovermis profundi]|uniref:DNA repair protein RadA n=1 Tax=Helicovermis profundi TaxID=3065157 RepID=A0AAU9E611_9FIRM|nr:DNA repair protein RadA [Clostridia bacterium S502]